MILVALLGCSEGIALTDAQRDDVRAIAAEIRATNEPRERVRAIAIAEARGRLGPRPDLGRCAASLATPARDDLGTFADEGVTFALSTAPISVVAAADLDKSEGPRWDRVQNALVNDVEAMLYGAYRAPDAAAIDAKFAKAKALTEIAWMPIDATLVIDRFAPAQIEGKTFTSGLVEGRFYVYDYAAEKVVCAAAVRAGNSDTLGVHLHFDDSKEIVGARSDADRDLYLNSVLAGISGLAAAGPVVFAVDF